MEDLRVLLVDDEQDIVDTIKYSLELRGLRVDTAYDGLTAEKMAKSGKYKLIILDVMLPGRNGYEVSRIIKEDTEAGKLPAINILLITARKLEDEFREDFVSTWSKADACLYKPFELEELLDKTSSLLSTAQGISG